MPNVTIKIKNLPQIKAAFAKAPKLMADNLQKAIKQSTLLIEGKSKVNTPVLTGFLRNSHVTRFSGGGLKFEGTVEPMAKYAMFVHEGTRFMKARPFLRDATESSLPMIDNIFERATQDVLDKIGREV